MNSTDPLNRLSTKLACMRDHATWLRTSFDELLEHLDDAASRAANESERTAALRAGEASFLEAVRTLRALEAAIGEADALIAPDDDERPGELDCLATAGAEQ